MIQNSVFNIASICVRKKIEHTKMLVIVISWMMEIIPEINSSLHMSISNLNIQKVIFIVYCFMKIYVSSLHAFPQAKHFAKTL